MQYRVYLGGIKHLQLDALLLEGSRDILQGRRHIPEAGHAIGHGATAPITREAGGTQACHMHNLVVFEGERYVK